MTSHTHEWKDVQKRAEGQDFLYTQCPGCGEYRTIGPAFEHQERWTAAPKYDESIWNTTKAFRDMWYAAKQEKKEKRESAKSVGITSDALRAYRESAAWSNLRFRAMLRDSGICQGCLGLATQVHHLQYPADAKDLGREPLFWLVAICEACHKRTHEIL